MNPLAEQLALANAIINPHGRSNVYFGEHQRDHVPWVIAGHALGQILTDATKDELEKMREGRRDAYVLSTDRLVSLFAILAKIKLGVNAEWIEAITGHHIPTGSVHHLSDEMLLRRIRNLFDD